MDVDACVARYGGELDSFYDEIPTDSSDTGYEPGHELTEKNHALRTMRTDGTKRFFEKRIRDNAEVKKIENNVGQLFPGSWKLQNGAVKGNGIKFLEIGSFP